VPEHAHRAVRLRPGAAEAPDVAFARANEAALREAELAAGVAASLTRAADLLERSATLADRDLRLRRLRAGGAFGPDPADEILRLRRAAQRSRAHAAELTS